MTLNNRGIAHPLKAWYFHYSPKFQVKAVIKDRWWTSNSPDNIDPYMFDLQRVPGI